MPALRHPLHLDDLGENCPTGAMVDLLPELRYEVVKILVTELDIYGRYRKRSSPWKTLLTLQGTAQEFTDMTIIKAALFDCITLQATTDHADQVRATDFAFLAPFVKKIILLPSPHNFNLSKKDFRTIFCNEEREEPVEESVLVEKYKSDRLLANDDKVLLHCGELERVWTTLLGQFRQVDTFSIKSLMEEHPLLPPWYSKTLRDIDGGIRVTLRKASQPTYSRFFRTAIRCISASKVDVRALDIDCEIVQAFRLSGWRGRDWRELRLGSLERLALSSPRFFDLGPDGRDRQARTTDGMAAVMSKISSSLEVIDLSQNSQTANMLPSLEIHGFPSLRSIALRGVSFHLNEFASAVTQMQELESIWLNNVDGNPSGDPNSTWKWLFEVIHNQKTPKLFILNWKHVWLAETHMDSLSFNLDPAYFDKQLPYYQDYGEPELSLFLYLEGRGAWNDKLQTEYNP